MDDFPSAPPLFTKPRSEWTFRDWLENEIAHLESIRRTEFGDGSLAAFKRSLKELDRQQPWTI